MDARSLLDAAAKAVAEAQAARTSLEDSDMAWERLESAQVTSCHVRLVREKGRDASG